MKNKAKMITKAGVDSYIQAKIKKGRMEGRERERKIRIKKDENRGKEGRKENRNECIYSKKVIKMM